VPIYDETIMPLGDFMVTNVPNQFL
jgi:hypothetical protein